MQGIHNILIIGAGQIGSRYLQGLARCSYPLRIYVVDINSDALHISRQRWEEALPGGESNKVVSYHLRLEDSAKDLDVVIVATTASMRLEVVSLVKSHAHVRYWILEKVLVQSPTDLSSLLSIMKSEPCVWVNLPRRTLSWHKRIREMLCKRSPLHLKVFGINWGLACNSLHFLDMLVWFTGESLLQLSTEKLEKEWIRSKRFGNLEIFGELKAELSGGSIAMLSVERGTDTEVCWGLSIDDGQFEWRINEDGGVAVRSDGFSIPGRLPYQSEATPLLIDQILSTGQCELPSLSASAQSHRLFLDALLGHWRRTVDPKAVSLPIT